VIPIHTPWTGTREKDATADEMYLRILVHANEHMGQLLAYARMTGIVPPWSKN